MNGARTRWIVVGLLFLSTVINYIDRQTLSILSPTLRREFHLSEPDYANAVSAFLIAYTVMYSLSGRLLDRIGVRTGLVLCIAWWSVATMLTSLAQGARSLEQAVQPGVPGNQASERKRPGRGHEFVERVAKVLFIEFVGIPTIARLKT